MNNCLATVRMRKNKKFPEKFLFFLQAVALLICIVFLVYPYIPAEFFAAKSPITNEPFLYKRSHLTLRWFILTWVFEGARDIIPEVRVLMFAVTVLVIFCLNKNLRFYLHRKVREMSPFVLYPAVFAVSVISFYLLKVDFGLSTNFADVMILPTRIQEVGVYGPSVLTDYYNIFLRDLFLFFNENLNSIQIAQLTPAVSGGFFTMAILFLSRTIGNNLLERIILFLGLMLTGSLVMFFGFAETTHLELASLSIYFAMAIKYITTKSNKYLWLILSIVSLSMVFMSHAAGLLVGFSLIVLLAENHHGIFKSLRGIFKLKKIFLVTMFILIPYYLLVASPFFLKGDFRDISEDGQLMFVPTEVDYDTIFHFASTDLPDYLKNKFFYQYNIYPMISWWHLADIINIFLLAAPFSVLLIMISLYLKRKDRIELNDEEYKVAGFLAVAAVFALFIPLTWKLIFGMWGDWNIGVTYLFPTVVFSWIFFMFISRKYDLNLNLYCGTVLLMIFVQFIFGLSLYVQIL